jgi:hypothetical protein
MMTATLETPTKKPQPREEPQLVFAQGIHPTRMEALTRAFGLGRRMALSTMPELLACPLHDDRQLEAEWSKGAATVPPRSRKGANDGGYDIFVAGRENGFFGIPSEKPADGVLAEIWLEGRQEGAAKAAKADQVELSFARGFRTGTEGQETERGPVLAAWQRGFLAGNGLEDKLIEKEDEHEGHRERILHAAYNRGWRMADSLPADALDCPYLSESEEEQMWFLGVEDRQEGKRRKNAIPLPCPFKPGSASAKIFDLLAKFEEPVEEGFIVETTGLPARTVGNLLREYVNPYHSAPLRRAGISFLQKDGKWSLKKVKADPNAKRVRNAKRCPKRKGRVGPKDGNRRKAAWRGKRRGSARRRPARGFTPTR